ncbi:hypothetical protein RRG08_020217 [Elysia crispata]|uniref:Uncharacterized protein n=1 Tax=Elysia crispata TaxID=231223 RepID=A0AAE1A2R8_9GAST|nr:hypothetical protein RRG08_020217 [Elysia crispata]
MFMIISIVIINITVSSSSSSQPLSLPSSAKIITAEASAILCNAVHAGSFVRGRVASPCLVPGSPARKASDAPLFAEGLFDTGISGADDGIRVSWGGLWEVWEEGITVDILTWRLT